MKKRTPFLFLFSIAWPLVSTQAAPQEADHMIFKDTLISAPQPTLQMMNPEESAEVKEILKDLLNKLTETNNEELSLTEFISTSSRRPPDEGITSFATILQQEESITYSNNFNNKITLHDNAEEEKETETLSDRFTKEAKRIAEHAESTWPHLTDDEILQQALSIVRPFLWDAISAKAGLEASKSVLQEEKENLEKEIQKMHDARKKAAQQIKKLKKNSARGWCGFFQKTNAAIDPSTTMEIRKTIKACNADLSWATAEAEYSTGGIKCYRSMLQEDEVKFPLALKKSLEEKLTMANRLEANPKTEHLKAEFLKRYDQELKEKARLFLGKEDLL